jgi:hypothetical protein
MKSVQEANRSLWFLTGIFSMSLCTTGPADQLQPDERRVSVHARQTL